MFASYADHVTPRVAKEVMSQVQVLVLCSNVFGESPIVSMDSYVFNGHRIAWFAPVTPLDTNLLKLLIQ